MDGSLAAGVVEGCGGALGFGLPGVEAAPWPPGIEEEGAGGGSGPAAAVVRLPVGRAWLGLAAVEG